jgi:hypothetical protein
MFKLYYIFPDKLLVYIFTDGTATHIYNAGNLFRIHPSAISTKEEVPGIITTKIGTNPLVIKYKNEKCNVIYIPDCSKPAIQGNGEPFTTNERVVAVAEILVPQTPESFGQELKPYPLARCNIDPYKINDYISNSLISFTPNTPMKLTPMTSTPIGGSPYLTNRSLVNTSDEVLDKVMILENNIIDVTRDLKSVKDDLTGKYDTITNKGSDLEIKIVELQKDLKSLKDSFTALMTRLYTESHISLPEYIDGLPVLSNEALMSKVDGGELPPFIIEPYYQGYGGGHRTNNRMFTFTLKNGGKYLVKGQLGPKGEYKPISRAGTLISIDKKS